VFIGTDGESESPQTTPASPNSNRHFNSSPPIVFDAYFNLCTSINRATSNLPPRAEDGSSPDCNAQQENRLESLSKKQRPSPKIEVVLQHLGDFTASERCAVFDIFHGDMPQVDAWFFRDRMDFTPIEEQRFVDLVSHGNGRLRPKFLVTLDEIGPTGSKHFLGTFHDMSKQSQIHFLRVFDGVSNSQIRREIIIGMQHISILDKERYTGILSEFCPTEYDSSCNAQNAQYLQEALVTTFNSLSTNSQCVEFLKGLEHLRLKGFTAYNFGLRKVAFMFSILPPDERMSLVHLLRKISMNNFKGIETLCKFSEFKSETLIVAITLFTELEDVGIGTSLISAISDIDISLQENIVLLLGLQIVDRHHREHLTEMLGVLTVRDKQYLLPLLQQLGEVGVERKLADKNAVSGYKTRLLLLLCHSIKIEHVPCILQSLSHYPEASIQIFIDFVENLDTEDQKDILHKAPNKRGIFSASVDDQLSFLQSIHYLPKKLWEAFYQCFLTLEESEQSLLNALADNMKESPRLSLLSNIVSLQHTQIETLIHISTVTSCTQFETFMLVAFELSPNRANAFLSIFSCVKDKSQRIVMVDMVCRVFAPEHRGNSRKQESTFTFAYPSPSIESFLVLSMSLDVEKTECFWSLLIGLHQFGEPLILKQVLVQAEAYGVQEYLKLMSDLISDEHPAMPRVSRCSRNVTQSHAPSLTQSNAPTTTTTSPSKKQEESPPTFDVSQDGFCDDNQRRSFFSMSPPPSLPAADSACEVGVTLSIPATALQPWQVRRITELTHFGAQLRGVGESLGKESCARDVLHHLSSMSIPHQHQMIVVLMNKRLRLSSTRPKPALVCASLGWQEAQEWCMQQCMELDRHQLEGIIETFCTVTHDTDLLSFFALKCHHDVLEGVPVPSVGRVVQDMCTRDNQTFFQRIRSARMVEIRRHIHYLFAPFQNTRSLDSGADDEDGNDFLAFAEELIKLLVCSRSQIHSNQSSQFPSQRSQHDADKTDKTTPTTMRGLCLDAMMQILQMTQKFASQLHRFEMTSVWKPFFKEFQELAQPEHPSTTKGIAASLSLSPDEIMSLWIGHMQKIMGQQEQPARLSSQDGSCVMREDIDSVDVETLLHHIQHFRRDPKTHPAEDTGSSIQQRDQLWTMLLRDFGVSPSFEKARLLTDHYEVVGSKRLHKRPWDFAVLAHVFSVIPHMPSKLQFTSCWDDIRENCSSLKLMVKSETNKPGGFEAMVNLLSMVQVHARRCEMMLAEGNTTQPMLYCLDIYIYYSNCTIMVKFNVVL
jgi:hypothetical protein